jgi:hypothetical protein
MTNEMPCDVLPGGTSASKEWIVCQTGTYLVWGVLLATRLRITLKYYLLLGEDQAAPGEESFLISIVSPGGEVSHVSRGQRLEVLTSNPVSTNVIF